MIKACVFDLDGTLLNTINTITYYANLALEHYGIEPYNTDDYKYMVGNGAKILIERMLDGRGFSGDNEMFDKVFGFYNEKYNSDVEYLTAPYDGICELLDNLKKEGITTAVLSNKPDYAAGEAVKTFLNGYFDVVHGQHDGIEIKPSPEGVFEILNELGLTSDEILYIGDTATDMQTGKSANAYTIGVLWGFRLRDELEGANADAIIEHPSEIYNILKKING